MTSMAPAIAILRDAYPRADFPDRTVRLYAALLADLDDDAVAQAVKRLVLGSEFLPSIAEIRREVAEAQLRLPTVEEAWDWAVRGGLREAPPELRAAVDAVGGHYRIRTTENPETLRSQFMRDYAARRRRALELFTGAAVPSLPPADTVELGPTMQSLPESDALRPRPVMMRLLRRLGGNLPGAPSEEEKSDAIRVLHRLDVESPIYREAERIFVEASQ